MLHMADYLASRKCLTMDFENFEAEKKEKPNLDTFIMPFGKKHKGELLIDIAKNDPTYIDWMRKELDRYPFNVLIKELDKRSANSNE